MKSNHPVKVIIIVLLLAPLLSSCAVTNMLESFFPPTPTTMSQPTSNQLPTATASATPLPTPTEKPPYDGPAEVFPQWIELDGQITTPDAELSGLAWYGDTLILLPQYPTLFEADNGTPVVFTLEKSDILAYLSGDQTTPLTAGTMAFNLDGIDQAITGFEGFESIAFVDDVFFVTIESTGTTGTIGYIVKGNVVGQTLTLDFSTKTIINPQTTIRNLSDEAMFIYNQQVFTVYENNGVDRNPNPIAHRFDLNLVPQSSIPFPNIEYRLTDSTQVDENGFFWMINLSNPSNAYFMPESDPIADTYGQGQTHAEYDLVERLIQFQMTDQGIVMVDRAPIQLNLTSGYFMRNWEGIAMLDQAGFLMTTDKVPGTLLAFVPLDPQ